jgi:hypothetical protein
MNRLMKKVAVAAMVAGAFAMVSCTSDQEKEAAKTPPAQSNTPAANNTAVANSTAAGSSNSSSTISMVAGEAGGMQEDTFTATATVSAIDPATRSVTLTGEDNSQASFIAGPEVKNFDQLKVGDKVTAELTERLTVFVRHDSADPTVTHAAALATAPKGAKPGVMVGQVFEITAKVTAIDTENRKATLQFSGGETREVPVRSDVDLTRYHVGDTVVMRVSETLSLLTKTP